MQSLIHAWDTCFWHETPHIYDLRKLVANYFLWYSLIQLWNCSFDKRSISKKSLSFVKEYCCDWFPVVGDRECFPGNIDNGDRMLSWRVRTKTRCPRGIFKLDVRTADTSKLIRIVLWQKYSILLLITFKWAGVNYIQLISIRQCSLVGGSTF